VIDNTCEYGKAFAEVPRDEIVNVPEVAITNVNVALALVTAAYVPSADFVAWTKHVPAVVALIVAIEVESESAHVIAVPPETMEYEIAPVPLPPVVVMESA